MNTQHPSGASGSELKNILIMEAAARNVAGDRGYDPVRFDVYLRAMAAEYEAYGETSWYSNLDRIVDDYQNFDDIAYEEYRTWFKENVS